MESISVKPIPIREKRVNLNPLRNPISSLHQWIVLKAKDDNGNEDTEIGSYQVFPKKGRDHANPLLNPVSDFHEWRALMAKDTKPLTTEQPLPLPQGRSLNSNQSFMEFDEEVAIDASLSCWLSSSETTPTK
ncbi:hypothetical protein CRYUN_Cryun29cG0007300 [Craigia yunnanensis]